MTVNHNLASNNVAWFIQQSGTIFTAAASTSNVYFFDDLYGGKFGLNDNFNRYGLWTGYGVAGGQSYSYQLGICDSFVTNNFAGSPIGFFFSGKSLLHSLDSRFKFVCLGYVGYSGHVSSVFKSCDNWQSDFGGGSLFFRIPSVYCNTDANWGTQPVNVCSYFFKLGNILEILVELWWSNLYINELWRASAMCSRCISEPLDIHVQQLRGGDMVDGRLVVLLQLQCRHMVRQCCVVVHELQCWHMVVSSCCNIHCNVPV